jgi:hypothetical protein
MRRFAISMLLAAAVFPASGAVTAGQVDTFEDGTTMDWGVCGAHPTPPANIASGGPGGIADNFLQLTSGGAGGPGSKLAAFNTVQWSGDYLAAGIQRISMSVNNSGQSDVDLRLLFINFAGMAPANIAISDAVHMPSGSGWQDIYFDIKPGDLTVLLGSAEAVLANAAELRIFHNPAADYPPPPNGPPAVTALLGIDNIEAEAVPEPTSVLLFVSGAGVLFWRRYSRPRSV